MTRGRILKGIGGFYYVQDQEARVHECKARGRFRKDGITPLPGDEVLFSLHAGSPGRIEEILPRRNELKRPRVANVDIAAIVVSAEKPKIDYLLVDKILVSAQKAGVEPLLIINKCDAATPQQADAIAAQYQGVCDIVCVSAKAGTALPALKSRLSGKCTCFAGQSAAGKSSLINAMFAGLRLETGGMAKKTDRGKHTTRQAELIVPEEFRGTVVDTPGFSFFDSGDIEPDALDDFYRDFEPFAGNCRFAGCLHTGEPDCGVAKALGEGRIHEERYQRYLLILKELQEKRQRQYD